MQSGKLLNRPKATNNISRDQVKPIEKEIQNEITKNGVKMSSVKTSKPIRLPSPVPKHKNSPKRNKSYDSESDSSDGGEFSSIETQNDSVKEKKRSPKVRSNKNSPRDRQDLRQQSSLVRQDSKNVVIPNIHQGWSVTVAGTHPDLAPDVEMKLSFPKAKGTVSTPESKVGSSANDHKPEVFYYKNNQLLPPPIQNELPNDMNYDHYDHKPYYNHRRSLSLARIDSGMSGSSIFRHD